MDCGDDELPPDIGSNDEDIDNPKCLVDPSDEEESLPSEFEAIEAAEVRGSRCCLKGCTGKPLPDWAEEYQELKSKREQDKWLFVNLRRERTQGVCAPAARTFLKIGAARYNKFRKAIKSGALDPPVDKRSIPEVSFRGTPKKDDVDGFFLWLYTDWAEPMPTKDIHEHIKKRGKETEKKLAGVRALLSTTMTQAGLPAKLHLMADSALQPSRVEGEKKS